jgi:hypothetical protein
MCETCLETNGLRDQLLTPIQPLNSRPTNTPQFHTFDALVILAGFVVDVLLHGVLEEVASLVVILRLWRFFKIIEEFSVGAEEQMDGLQLRIEQLETENQDLKAQLKKSKAVTEGEDDDVEQGLGKGKGTDGSGSGLWSQ